MKKAIALLTSLLILTLTCFSSFAENGENKEAELISDTDAYAPKIEARSAVLMESRTGRILFSHNEGFRASPASVTKIMTLLIVCEAIRDGRIALDDKVSVSENAASLGGSQVFLKEGEIMTVDELIKCTVIASANDAATALSEHVCGTVESFVSEMNKRADELGLRNTEFENPTGLDDTTVNHYTSAEDIAIMSRELIKYDEVMKYSSIWQDTIRNGEFTLTNTNRLVRYYEGCTGLKTGSTDKAGYCVSTTAKRGEMHLIAVIMGAESRESRNAAARALLDYGFSNFTLYEDAENRIDSVPIICGANDIVDVYSKGFSTVVEKGKLKSVEREFKIPENINAPIKSGEIIGKIVYKLDGAVIGECDLYVNEDVDKLSFFGLFLRILAKAVFS